MIARICLIDLHRITYFFCFLYDAERNYECLGITCTDVGGIWDDASGVYISGAEPCKDGSKPRRPPRSSSGDKINEEERDAENALGVTFVGITVALILIFVIGYVTYEGNKSRFRPEQVNTNDEFPRELHAQIT